MTNDELLAEAARLIRLDSNTRPCPHGEYSNGTFYHCDKCRGCQDRAWLAHYESARGTRGEPGGEDGTK